MKIPEELNRQFESARSEGMDAFPPRAINNPWLCPICGKQRGRNGGKHATCSKILQQRYRDALR